MSLETNDSFIQASLSEDLENTDPHFAILTKLVEHLQLTLVNLGEAENGISILKSGSPEAFVGTYAIQEDGNGETVGMVKNVDGTLYPISPSLPGEIRLQIGGGVGPLVPWRGWEIVADEELQRRYNVGTSPNWNVAAVRYIGI